MMRTTSAPPIDVTALVPALAQWVRSTVRLHPRRGTPGASQSHVGGPLLWGPNEDWPTCDEHSRDIGEPGAGRFVVVGQFFSRDLPEFFFPSGFDMVQILWCPNDHYVEYPWGGEYEGPDVRIFWRDSKSITDFVPMIPELPPLLNDAYRVHPCTISPEMVAEYPFVEELPDELMRIVDEIDRARDFQYQYALSVAKGWKVGGWANWNVTGIERNYCPNCRSDLRLLLKVDSSEWDGASDRWWPLEDRALTPDGMSRAYEPTGVDVGRFGELRVFICQQNAMHRPVLNIQ
ncbi:hypothetical protein ACIBLA_03810 [Streptomyces sp. NPDC050433]|uniref:hypothetical protein n=1 Tax=unclassified Streptomyces TaxID=2593676 RepID=UPI0034164854